MKILSSFRYQTTYTVRGLLGSDLVIDLQKGYKGRWTYYDLDGKVVATQVDDILTLLAGFECDLCSPAFRAGKWWIGTWTTRREALAAFLHDFARGCVGAEHSPWDRRATDDLFWDALDHERSRVQRIYHWAVSSWVGTAFMRMTHRTRYRITYAPAPVPVTP